MEYMDYYTMIMLMSRHRAMLQEAARDDLAREATQAQSSHQLASFLYALNTYCLELARSVTRATVGWSRIYLLR
jgi:hypothetical protein